MKPKPSSRKLESAPVPVEDRSALTPAQQVALDAMLTGSTIQRAADQAGVHKRTVYRWMKERSFRSELRGSQMESVSNALAITMQMLPVMLDTLFRIATDTTIAAQSRVTAATNVARIAQEMMAFHALSDQMTEMQETIRALQPMTAREFLGTIDQSTREELNLDEELMSRMLQPLMTRKKRKDSTT